MCTIVTGLAPFEGYYSVIHRRAGEADAGIFVATVTIGFRASVNNRNVGAIRVIGYIRHARSACGMAAGRLTAARDAGVVKARGIGKCFRGMTRTAVRTRHNMVCRFTGGAENGAAMTVRTRLPGHFRATVIEGAPSKRCRCWRVTDVTNRAVT